MTLELGMITIDCADPQGLATFWADALGTEISHDHGEFLFLTPAKPDGPALGFQRVPEPRAGKNRLHLDFGSGDRDGEVQRLVALGAVEKDEHEAPGLAWTVLADPEGNEFCVATQSTPPGA